MIVICSLAMMAVPGGVGSNAGMAALQDPDRRQTRLSNAAGVALGAGAGRLVGGALGG